MNGEMEEGGRREEAGGWMQEGYAEDGEDRCSRTGDRRGSEEMQEEMEEGRRKGRKKKMRRRRRAMSVRGWGRRMRD